MLFFQKNISLFACIGDFLSFVILLLPAVIVLKFFMGNANGIGFINDRKWMEQLFKDLETKASCRIF